jgi:site-specific DNA-methyltransferase (adenine-specific)
MIKLDNDDCLNILKNLPDNSIDSIITDPPYGISLINQTWDYDLPAIEIFQELHRVAKPGSYFLCFGGTRTFHRLACRIEDSGFNIKDTIMWIYGSSMPKGANIGKDIDKKFGNDRSIKFIDNEWKQSGPISKEALNFDGYHTGIKPAYEPIIIAFKSPDGTYSQNALKYGVAGLNIDACRIPSKDSKNFRNVSFQNKSTFNHSKITFQC